MTVCNMAIEGGARCGYVNPDSKTFEFLRGRPHAPGEGDWDDAVARWESFASDPDAEYDDIVIINAADIEPTVTWGISPDQGIGIGESIPTWPSSGRVPTGACPTSGKPPATCRDTRSPRG